MFYVENCIKSTENLLQLELNKCGRQEHFCIDCDVSDPADTCLCMLLFTK